MLARWITTLCIVLTATAAGAQETEQNTPTTGVADIAKRVLLDPTTYAPAIIAYDGTYRDWKSSQPFFRAGFYEHNSRFTISGLPNDVALSYDAGKRRIFTDAMITLQVSFVNNVTDQIFERVLIQKYPEHRKLIRTLGWVERIGAGSYLAYMLSADHYRQWQRNEELARQFGYR